MSPSSFALMSLSDSRSGSAKGRAFTSPSSRCVLRMSCSILRNSSRCVAVGACESKLCNTLCDPLRDARWMRHGPHVGNPSHGDDLGCVASLVARTCRLIGETHSWTRANSNRSVPLLT